METKKIILKNSNEKIYFSTEDGKNWIVDYYLYNIKPEFKLKKEINTEELKDILKRGEKLEFEDFCRVLISLREE
jgi:hypothetical protein